MAKGTTKELGLRRVSCNAWEYENCGWGEQWLVIAHVRGTAGTLTEYCWARYILWNDGTDTLEYVCPADKEDLEKYMSW